MHETEVIGLGIEQGAGPVLQAAFLLQQRLNTHKALFCCTG